MYDLRDPKFYDEADLEKEMRRVFDVCHTCRMCFSYCPSFPSLFNAIDKHEEAGRGEVDALTTAEMNEVVDLCWQCKLCYVKCPYTPPHKFAVDFPRLLMRAKFVKTKREGVPFRERMLSDPDRIARFSGVLANWANRQPLFRRVLERLLGIHRKRVLPKFRKWKKPRSTGKDLVLFATCSVENNYPQVGVAAVQVLEKNGKKIAMPPAVCCGLPAMDGGDLETAIKKIEQNLKVLPKGVPIVVLAPSCSLQMKSEWPRLVPTD